jgi:hypothetical protein
LGSRENLERQSQSQDMAAGKARHGRPRVVIFEDDGEPRVEILELPESAHLGDLFCHCGMHWQIMATRTGDRVLIARPVEA